MTDPNVNGGTKAAMSDIRQAIANDMQLAPSAATPPQAAPAQTPPASTAPPQAAPAQTPPASAAPPQAVPLALNIGQSLMQAANSSSEQIVHQQTKTAPEANVLQLDVAQRVNPEKKPDSPQSQNVLELGASQKVDPAQQSSDQSQKNQDSSNVLELGKEAQISSPTAMAGNDPLNPTDGSDTEKFEQRRTKAPILKMPSKIVLNNRSKDQVEQIKTQQQEILREQAKMLDKQGDKDSILSSSSTKASTKAIRHLHRSIRMGNKDETLEEMVRGELRPMLKDWLDNNLANIVNELVDKEIERLTNDYWKY
ncbi:MAG: DUF2497 domain-containing protein [Pseudomonadota bacterium]